MRTRKPAPFTALLGALIVAALLASLSGAASAYAQAPRWHILTRSAPTNLPPGGEGEIVSIFVNFGDAPIVGTPGPGSEIEVSDKLPPHMTATHVEGAAAPGVNGSHQQLLLSNCAAAPAPHCSFSGTLPPYIAVELRVRVHVESDASPSEVNEATAKAGALEKTGSKALTVSSAPTPFGIESYEVTPEEEDGSLDSRAGSHPFQLTTTLNLNETYGKDLIHPELTREFPSSPALLRNVRTVLPPGLVADTRASAFPQCSAVDFAAILSGNINSCPADTAIGVAIVTFKEPIFFTQLTETVPVFNLAPERGEPARFGFVYEKVPVTLDTHLQTGGTYAAEVNVANTSEAAELMSSVVTVWGAPGAQQHNESRGWDCIGDGFRVSEVFPKPECPPTSTVPAESQAFLDMPTTKCGVPLTGEAQVQSWVPKAEFVPAGGFQAENSESLQGCNKLELNPSLSVSPDQHEAATPTGLNVEVGVPQESTLTTGDLGESDIDTTVLALPEGMEASPGAANGLGTCSDEALGFNGSVESEQVQNDHFNGAGVSCPEASKIGTVNIKTPLLENEVVGSVYFAQQNTNPFMTPLVLYIVAEDPVSGTLIKLAGEVQLGASNGQLVSVFRNAPPLPFEKLKLHLFNGGRASQSTPALCGNHTANASFEKSDQEGSVPAESTFTVTPNADGQPCPEAGALAFNPSAQVGSSNTQAGAFSAVTVSIARPDGDQALKTISMELPEGLAAVLSTVPECPEPQASQGTCPPESLIGHSLAESGLGGDPFTLPGDVYLTGPYNGAPFGLSSVTPATSVGPFDVGTSVVRSSINVNRTTAAAIVNTEASQFFRASGGVETSPGLPQFTAGTPDQIKELNVTIDRPGFQFNPTGCEERHTSVTLTGWEGATFSKSLPFQATGCAGLPFNPEVVATVGGQASKPNGADFKVVINSSGLGQANIRKVDLTIPEALPSRLSTLQLACLESVFNVSPEKCGEGSIIGEGTVYTPVLKNPLHGLAYLVAHGGAEFPDVEFVLKGENGLELLLDGKTLIKKGITYSRFETSPDAPFTKFESNFPTGPHSALTANNKITPSYNLCSVKMQMQEEITGQNGAFIDKSIPVSPTGCVLGSKTKKLTNAQLLAKALKTCRTKYKAKSKKKKKLACEKAAHKKYGPKKKPKKQGTQKR